MKTDSTPNPPEELEVRITALLLGELSADEAALVRSEIGRNPDLQRLHDRLQLTMSVVQATLASTDESVPVSVPKLSENRRQKLLQHFKTFPAVASMETQQPMSQPARHWRMPWYVPMSLAAVLIGLLSMEGLLRETGGGRSEAIVDALGGSIDVGLLRETGRRRSESDSLALTRERFTPAPSDGNQLGLGVSKRLELRDREVVTGTEESRIAAKPYGALSETKYLGLSFQGGSPSAAKSRGQTLLKRADEVVLNEVAAAAPSPTETALVSEGRIEKAGEVAASAPAPAAPPQGAPHRLRELREDLPPAPAPAALPQGTLQDSVKADAWFLGNTLYDSAEGVAGVAPKGSATAAPSRELDRLARVADAKDSAGKEDRAPSELGYAENKSVDAWGFSAAAVEATIDGVLRDTSAKPRRFSAADSSGGSGRVGAGRMGGGGGSAPDINNDGKSFGGVGGYAYGRTRGVSPAAKTGPAAANQVAAGDFVTGGTDKTTGFESYFEKPVGFGNASLFGADLQPALKTKPLATSSESKAEASAAEKAFAETSSAEGEERANRLSELQVERKAGNAETLHAQTGLSAAQAAPEKSPRLAARYGLRAPLAAIELSTADKPLEDNFGENRDKTTAARPRAETRLGRQLAVRESVAVARVEELEQAKKGGDEIAPVVRLPVPVPQPEVSARENAYSTFSLNVSDVSFKLAAASLEKGILPEPASIRGEEFINAFHYRDPEPASGVPVGFTWERARDPFAQDREILRFAVRTATEGREAGRPLNIVLLLDNSGSMERADRVRIVREAIEVLARQLHPQDRISVVTFSRTARLWIDGMAGDHAGELTDRVGSLTPEGGTNLEEALDLGYKTASRHFLSQGGNRVVLLTDGAANLGDVSANTLKAKVESWRRRGIALDCFGVGWEGLNDDLLEVLSRNGDGRYGFINSPEDAASGFAAQLAGALHVAAADVKVQVEFNPQRVSVWRQIGYARHQLTKAQFRDNTVDAAELAAAESGNALYVVQTDAGGNGPIATVRVRHRDPATGIYREQEWPVPYTGAAVAMERAPVGLRLASSAAAFSEWLAQSPFAAAATPDVLIRRLEGIRQAYAPDPTPAKLEEMVGQARSIWGK